MKNDQRLKHRKNTAISLAVNLDDPTAPEQHKILFVIFDGRATETIAGLARTAQTAWAHILVASSGEHGAIPGADQFPNLHMLDKDRHDYAGPVQGACQLAHRLGITHLVFLHPVRHLTIEEISIISVAIEENPNALIIGRSGSAARPISRLTRWRRSLANFFYRLQTGYQLDEVNSGLYAFPLTVLQSLPWSQRPHIFLIQSPVKAAWAGVDIEQTTIPDGMKIDNRSANAWASMGNAISHVLMSLHLTMRAITPWPHRKITAEASKPGEKISVFHPFRSIKTLLTENTTPWKLCLATALGVFIGALPLIAIHTIVILFAAGYFRLNKVAALTASQLCMPPIVPALCIETGHFLRYGNFLTEISINTIGYQALDRIYEWFLGSLLLGPILAVIVGAFVFLLAILAHKKLIVV